VPTKLGADPSVDELVEEHDVSVEARHDIDDRCGDRPFTGKMLQIPRDNSPRTFREAIQPILVVVAA